MNLLLLVLVGSSAPQATDSMPPPAVGYPRCGYDLSATYRLARRLYIIPAVKTAISAQGGKGLIDTNTPNVMILLPSIIVFISDNHRLSAGFCLKVRSTSQINPFSSPIPQPAKIFHFFSKSVDFLINISGFSNALF